MHKCKLVFIKSSPGQTVDFRCAGEVAVENIESIEGDNEDYLVVIGVGVQISY